MGIDRYAIKVYREYITKRKFKKRMGYSLSLKQPQSFNEKIQYLKLNDYEDNELITKCADKYSVREYVKEKGYEQILVPLLGCWNHVEEIDFEKLPNKFVLKCNHGSGWNIICKDKRELDIESVKRNLKNWLSMDFSKRFMELQYKNIIPKIIAEKYLESDILDYKFFCFNGKPQYMYISQEIEGTNGKVKCCFWDCDANVAPFYRTDEYFYNEQEMPKIPKKFNEMKTIATKLSQDFKFVRVDFFEVNDKIYFSELTFTPAAGMMPLKPIEWDRRLGELIEL